MRELLSNTKVMAVVVVAIIGVSGVAVILFMQTPGSSLPRMEPFEISSDDEFTENGFVGSGTQIDPYILDGVYIPTTSQEEPAVYIHDTDAYFIISECMIVYTHHADNIHGDTGVELRRLSNGILSECSIVGFNLGIDLQDAEYCSILDNDISECYIGVGAYGDGGHFIAWNYCHDNGIGISLISLEIVGIVLGNDCSYNDIGFKIDGADYWEISRNNFTNNDEGAKIWRAFHYTVEDNLICDNTGEYGIELRGFDQSLFQNNTVCRNSGPGLYIIYSDYSTFENNRIYDNEDGPYEEVDSTNNTFDDFYVPI